MRPKNFPIVGIHAVDALLKTQPQRVERLVFLNNRDDKKIQSLLESAKSLGIKVEHFSRQDLDRMAEGENHQGVIAFCTPAKTYSENDLENLLDTVSKPFLLVLDGVQDPHNLGACLRTADAAGVHAVIAPKDNAVGMTPTVSKVASGAAEKIPYFQVTNLARTLKGLKERGIWVFGAAGEADKNIFAADLRGSIAIVLGAEGTGLRRLTREHCDVLLKIPMQGSVSSLNVSVAAGVFLFEALRQNNPK